MVASTEFLSLLYTTLACRVSMLPRSRVKQDLSSLYNFMFEILYTVAISAKYVGIYIYIYMYICNMGRVARDKQRPQPPRFVFPWKIPEIRDIMVGGLGFPGRGGSSPQKLCFYRAKMFLQTTWMHNCWSNVMCLHESGRRLCKSGLLQTSITRA